MDPTVASSILTALVTAVITVGGAVVAWRASMRKTDLDGNQKIYEGYQKLQQQTLQQITDARAASAEAQAEFIKELDRKRQDWMQLSQNTRDVWLAELQRERDFFSAQLILVINSNQKQMDTLVREMERNGQRGSEEHRVIIDLLTRLLAGQPVQDVPEQVTWAPPVAPAVAK